MDESIFLTILNSIGKLRRDIFHGGDCHFTKLATTILSSEFNLEFRTNLQNEKFLIRRLFGEFHNAKLDKLEGEKGRERERNGSVSEQS